MRLHHFLPGAKAWSSTSDPDAPVVIRFAALGDVVLLTVLLEALHQRYGRPVHVLGSGPWTSVLLDGRPAVAEVRLLSSRRSPYWLTPSQQAAASRSKPQQAAASRSGLAAPAPRADLPVRPRRARCPFAAGRRAA